jgi:predicted aspartyl protease
MAFGAGHFDQGGNPSLKFHLCGVVHPQPGVEFEGVLDTGFSGFIQLPIQHAFSLKLPLEGTAGYILADGSNITALTALATTTFCGKSVVGVVTLAQGSKHILLGMGFLRQFKMGVLMLSNAITFIDEEEIERMQKAALQHAQAAAAAAAAAANKPEEGANPPGPKDPGGPAQG